MFSSPRNTLFLASAVLILATNGYGQGDSSGVHRDAAALVVVTDAVYVVPSFLTMLCVHEFGHYLLASVFGAEDVRIGLYRKTPTETQLGWNDWEQGSLSSFGNAVANGGGVVFSRGLAEGSHLFVHSVRLPGWGQRFFSMTFILSRFDFPRYVLQDATLNLFDKRGDDIDKVVTEIAGHKTGWRTVTYSALLALATIDVILDWDRISMHWKALGGTPYDFGNPEEVSQVKVRPFLDGHSAGISMHVMW
jgi:hypothetical protein